MVKRKGRSMAIRVGGMAMGRQAGVVGIVEDKGEKREKREDSEVKAKEKVAQNTKSMRKVRKESR